MSVVKDIIDTVLSINKKNLKFFIPIILVLGIFFPFIDSAFIKPFVIQKKIEILTQINTIDDLEINNETEERLREDIYNLVDDSLVKGSITINPYTLYKQNPWKFYSGISIWLLVLVILLFQKNKGKWYVKIGTFILVLIFAFLVGIIGLLIPTIVTPWINYFMYPILQIIVIYSAVDSSNKKKKEQPQK